MSPQDSVERVLKEIHVMFSRCQGYGSSPDKVIVDRKQFLQLLDRLNQGIYDMMEEYEHTRESRNRAELAFQHKGQAMINDASGKADDVYAASVVYTADMLGKVQDLIDQANESMSEVFRSFKKELRSQKDIVRSNELELESQLQDMADAKIYQGMLEDIRAEQRKEKRKEEDKKKEQAYARRSPYSREHIQIPAVSADVRINEDYFEKAGISAEDAKAGYVPSPAPLTMEKPDVKVNFNSEYFKRKAALEAQNGEQPYTEEGVVSDVSVGDKTDFAGNKTDSAGKSMESEVTTGKTLQRQESALQTENETEETVQAYENYTGSLENACTDSDKARKTAVSELRSLLSNMEANAEPQYMGEAESEINRTTGNRTRISGTASEQDENRKVSELPEAENRKKQQEKDVNKTMEWEIAQEHLLNDENADLLQDYNVLHPSGSKKGTAGWKERMKVLLNEITPKDLDEK